MPLMQSYLFRQLRGPTLQATAALTGVAILAEALSAIGGLLSQRQSPLVFAKVVLLAMPQLMVLVLPIALLIAGLVAMNRLHRDNELTICFSGGMSRWDVVAPALRLATLMAGASLVVTLWGQPLSYRALRDTIETARADGLTSMIRPGQFTHPAPGMTVYAQSVDDDGGIRNLFIDRRLESGRDTTITAREGRLKKRGGAAMLVLRHGANQELSPTGVLNFLAFDEYILDLRPFVAARPGFTYKLSDRYLHELFFPDMSQAWEQANVKAMLAEGHSRLAVPLYNFTFILFAVAAVLGGSFDRMGYGHRMAAAAAAALFIRTLGFAAQAASATNPALNSLQYGVPILGAILCLGLLVGTGVGGPRATTAQPAVAA